MKSQIIILTCCIIVFLTGCSCHYYKVNNDMIHIYLKKQDAEIVYFVSSIDGYEMHKAKRVGRKTWEVTVPAKVEFRYFYIINGKVYVPSCQYMEKDDFGSKNCLFVPRM
jgi:hypothetical protein